MKKSYLKPFRLKEECNWEDDETLASIAKEILTTKETCELLRVSRRTLFRAVQERRIPYFKFGTMYRFSRKAILKVIEDKEVYSKVTRPYDNELSSKQVCNYLGINRYYLRRLVDQGKINCIRVGGSIRFTQEDVNEYLRLKAIECEEALRIIKQKMRCY